jgi:hypothetical protein
MSSFKHFSEKTGSRQGVAVGAVRLYSMLVYLPLAAHTSE